MSTTKTALIKHTTQIFKVATNIAACEFNNCWIKVEDGSIVLFDPSFDHVYAPEYRLCGLTEGAIVNYLRDLALPAPSKYLTSETPKDDKKLKEVFKGIIEDPQELTDDLSVYSLELVKEGTPTLQSVDTIKFSRLYNADTEALGILMDKLHVSSTKPVRRSPSSIPNASGTKSRAKPKTTEVTKDEVSEVTKDEVSEGEDAQIPEHRQITSRRRSRRRSPTNLEDTPEQPDTPETPETPETIEDVSEQPEQPEKPEKPEQPEQPKKSEDTTEVKPETPETSEVPETPVEPVTTKAKVRRSRVNRINRRI